MIGTLEERASEPIPEKSEEERSVGKGRQLETSNCGFSWHSHTATKQTAVALEGQYCHASWCPESF